MLNHHNPKYSGGVPLAIGDRYYAQDMFRDMRYYQFQLGQTVEKIVGTNTAILDGLVVSQGTGHTIDITAGMGIVPFLVDIVDRTATWALPPDVEQVDINMFLTLETGLNNWGIVGVTTDGATTNYVKLAYFESDQNTRTRIKSSGTYSYEVKPSYTISVNSTVPTSYQITLATFTTDGTTITFTHEEDVRVSNLNYLSKYQIASIPSTLVSNAKYLSIGLGIDLTLPEKPIPGDTVEVYSTDYNNQIIPNDDQVIMYNDEIWSSMGSNGALATSRASYTSLVYRGIDALLDEIGNMKLDNPSTLPPADGLGVSFSPDGNFLAVGHGISPFVTIYSISGTTFTKITNPGTLPADDGRDVAFSPNSDFLAVAHFTSPYITIYSISGTTFTKLTNPGTLPTGNSRGVAFSPDGNFLAVAHTTSPYVTIYSISGTTFTKITNPTILPTGGGFGVSFSTDGNFMSVAHDLSPYVTIYSISGTTFTKITNPAILPTGIGNGVSFSSDSDFLVVSHNTTPYITIYSISGTTFTKITNPTTLPTNTAKRSRFSPEVNFLAVAHFNSPNVTIYRNLVNNENIWNVLSIDVKNGETIADLFT